MNSFSVLAIGNLAKSPELESKASGSFTRFCLIGNDFAGRDDDGEARELTTSLWLVAFGATAEAIAKHARRGDQLIVHAGIRANNWTNDQGEKQYDYSFVVDGFKFGAPGRLKREEFDERREDSATALRGGAWPVVGPEPFSPDTHHRDV